MWQTSGLNLNGHADLLFDLLGGAARPLGDDLHPVVGDIRVGFDGQFMEGEATPQHQHKTDKCNQQFLA